MTFITGKIKTFFFKESIRMNFLLECCVTKLFHYLYPKNICTHNKIKLHIIAKPICKQNVVIFKFDMCINFIKNTTI